MSNPAWGKTLDKLIEVMDDGVTAFLWIVMILFFLPAMVIFVPIGAGVKFLKWLGR